MLSRIEVAGTRAGVPGAGEGPEEPGSEAELALPHPSTVPAQGARRSMPLGTLPVASRLPGRTGRPGWPQPRPWDSYPQRELETAEAISPAADSSVARRCPWAKSRSKS